MTLKIVDVCNLWNLYIEAQNVFTSAGERFNLSSCTAHQLLHNILFLPTGIAPLDALLCGGIQLGTLTEVVGVPGIGKTQFCIGFCVNTLMIQMLSGDTPPGSIIYFDTELKFDPNRVIEMASAAFPAIFHM
jgi:RecA/RadA recombinase